MFIDLLDKLLDRLVELSQKSEPIDRELVEQLAHPAFVDFEALHETAVTALLGYQETLSENPILGPDHPMFSAIVRDSLLRKALRNRLKALRASAAASSELDSFLTAITAYLQLEADSFPTEELLSVVHLGPAATGGSETDELPSRFRFWLALQKEIYRIRAELGPFWEDAGEDPAKAVAEIVDQAALNQGDPQVDAQMAAAALDTRIQALQAHRSLVVMEHEKLLRHLSSPAGTSSTGSREPAPGGA